MVLFLYSCTPGRTLFYDFMHAAPYTLKKSVRTFTLFYLLVHAAPYTLRKMLVPLLLLAVVGALNGKAPTLIKPQEKVFIELCDVLEKKLARDIEILVYEPDIFTASPELQASLARDFKLLLEVQNLIRRFTAVPVKTALAKSDKIKIDNLDEADHTELLGLAAVLNIESVLMTSITVFEDEKRKMWDKSKRQWVEKKVALIQGNVFNSSNGKIMVRFSYYFLIDKS